MQKKITNEVFIAYSLCPRKAFLLLCSNERGVVPEYSQALRLKKEASQQSYIRSVFKSMYGITAELKPSANVRFADRCQRFFDGPDQLLVRPRFGLAQVGFDL